MRWILFSFEKEPTRIGGDEPVVVPAVLWVVWKGRIEWVLWWKDTKGCESGIQTLTISVQRVQV